MSIKEKLKKELKALALKPTKLTRNEEHLYADFVELMTLFANDDQVTETDLVDRFRDYGVSDSRDDSELRDEINGSTTDELDANERWARSVFIQLADRSQHFEQSYPYEVSDSRISLKDNLTEKQRVYLMLLCCSNLNYFPKLLQTLTTEFEAVSFEALKSLFPAHADVQEFGKNSPHKGVLAKDKITALAEVMRLEVNATSVKKVMGRQERGLDVAGWISFSDCVSNVFSILGQCACGKDWPSKQNETRRYSSSYLRFENRKPIHALFIPYSLVNFGDHTFYQGDEVNDDTLVLERGRILELLDSTAFFKKLHSHQIVEGCIAHSEPLV